MGVQMKKIASQMKRRLKRMMRKSQQWLSTRNQQLSRNLSRMMKRRRIVETKNQKSSMEGTRIKQIMTRRKTSHRRKRSKNQQLKEEERVESNHLLQLSKEIKKVHLKKPSLQAAVILRKKLRNLPLLRKQKVQLSNNNQKVIMQLLKRKERGIEKDLKKLEGRETQLRRRRMRLPRKLKKQRRSKKSFLNRCKIKQALLK